MRGVLCVTMLAAGAGNVWGLAQAPAFGERGARSNRAVVLAAALSVHRGHHLPKAWLNRNLWNATGEVRRNGVIDIRYGTGRHSYTVAGLGARAKFRQLGVLFPRPITEVVGETPVAHLQVFPLRERILARLRGYRRGRGYDMEVKTPDLGLSPTDEDLLDRLLRGDALDRGFILKNWPHKVALENPLGRTIYLRLDNPSRGGVRVLRLKGVMPRGGWFRRIAGFTAPVRSIFADSDTPRMVGTLARVAAGTMLESEARREFEMAPEFDGDEAPGLGIYGARLHGARAGFVLYGMRGDDVRVRYDIGVDIQTREIDPIPEPDRFFEALGAQLRGLHDRGIVHRAFHLGNIGVGPRGPIIRDLEDAGPMSGNLDAWTRAAWRFDDVSWPLFNWSHAETAPSHARAFLRGYFGFDPAPGVIFECSSPDFAEHLSDMEIGRKTVIPQMFPALFRALLELESVPPAGWEDVDGAVQMLGRMGRAA